MNSCSLKILLFLTVFISSCSPWIEITPEQAYIMINKNKTSYTLIDMSKSFKYRDGHIANAISIEFHPKTFRKEISLIDKTKTIIIYCGTGTKTEKAKFTMDKLNFKKFYIISGGLKAWKGKNYPVVQ